LTLEVTPGNGCIKVNVFVFVSSIFDLSLDINSKPLIRKRRWASIYTAKPGIPVNSFIEKKVFRVMG